MKPSEVPQELRALHAWMEQVEAGELCERLPSGIAHDDAARLNALLQLDHLRSYPLIRKRLQTNQVRLSAWFFDVAHGEIEEYYSEVEKWLPVGAELNDAQNGKPEAHSGETPKVAGNGLQRVGA
jgi:carbonic anhydrase